MTHPDAAVPVAWLPRLFNVSESTIRRWMREDDLATFPHPSQQSRPGMPDLAIRWGDIPPENNHPTRWHPRKR